MRALGLVCAGRGVERVVGPDGGTAGRAGARAWGGGQLTPFVTGHKGTR